MASLPASRLGPRAGNPTRRVQVLDPIVAERIAAGEVVERPASVVKELIENSLDAEATEITVQLEEGGRSLIEVTDNGVGILPDDLPVCVRRHATSKISRFEDLESLGTLGFRGEALPSIGAVSELQILSRARGEDTAHLLRLGPDSPLSRPEVDRITFGHFLGSEHGTRIQARGLFSQVPARLKFLKSQGAEVGQVREWMERLALAHPGVGFKLISEGRTVLSLRPRGPGKEAERIGAILAGHESYPVIEASRVTAFGSSARGELRLRAFWLQGLSSPQAKKIVQIVNGRVVRDRLIQQAIMTSFRQALLPGQFPAVVLYVGLDPAELDVNVHPTKTEVRFLDGRKIFTAVDRLFSSMIEEKGAPAAVAARASLTTGVPGPLQGEEPGAPSPTRGECADFSEGMGPELRLAPPTSPPPRWRASEPAPTEQKPFDFRAQPSAPLSPPAVQPGERVAASHQGGADPAVAAEPASAIQALGLAPERLAGIIFNTYLMYDLGRELVLVDQHAAHERIRYEKLRARALGGSTRGSGAPPQALLIPETAHFAEADKPVIESRIPWLEALGFEAELFGESALLFRAVPAEWGFSELKPRLRNLVERLIHAEAEGHSRSGILLDSSLFEKLASEACHSAVRAGDRLEPLEARHLVDALGRCEHPWNCPHGRPTIVRIARGRIEEWFQRRI